MRSMSKSTTRKRHAKRSPGPLWRWAFYSLALLVLIVGIWLIYLDMEVRAKFDGRKWALPARVYAQPLELYDGRQLTLEDWRYQMQVLGYQPVENISREGQWAYHRGEVEVFIRSHQVQENSIASRRLRFSLSANQVQGLRVLQGQAAALVSLEPALIGGIYPRIREDRELVQLAEVPSLLGEALIAVEDRRFVNHFGISPRAIARAAWANFRSGRVVQGGSTLTQQLVKNFYLTQRRDLSRKLTEVAMSVLLEIHYSKAEILETYINEVYLGQSGPRQIHGFGLAARHYFQRPLADLKTQEIALLVGLVKGASYYNPWRHPQRATERRNLVLQILAREGLVSAADSARLQKLPLGVVAESERRIHDYPAFIDLVKRQLLQEYSEDALSSEGLSIYTTLSLAAQRRAEQALASKLQTLESGYRQPGGSLQGAIVVTAIGSGEIEALVGDRSPRFAGFNRALDASRPIGSLVKPAVYLSALSADTGLHLASLISDKPLQVELQDGSVWRPENFDHTSHGDVLLIDALSHSLNQATARLGMELRLARVKQSLRSLGVEADIPEVPALLLGALQLSPLEVSAMYHTLANDGVVVPLRAIRSVVDASGHELSRYPLRVNEGADPATVGLVQFGLQETMRAGTGKSIYRKLPESLALAGKTGTSNDQRDSWFAGFSGQHLGVVWLGRDDNGATPLTGATGALQVWGEIFAGLPTRGLDIMPADEVDYLWVDGETGRLSAQNCKGARLMPFLKMSRPTEKANCQWIRNPVLNWLQQWF